MRTLKIMNKTGIHARPASELCRLAQNFSCDVFLVKNGREYNAKSIMTILSMAIQYGDLIGLMADGVDSEAAVNEIYKLLEGINQS